MPEGAIPARRGSGQVAEPAGPGRTSGGPAATISRMEAAMSEQGWRRFLAAEGVTDWVVLHGGAMAVFRVPSLAEAARLAEAVAQMSGLDGALMTLTDGQLTVRLGSPGSSPTAPATVSASPPGRMAPPARPRHLR